MPAFTVHYIVKKTRIFFADNRREAVTIAKETLPITDGPTARVVQCLAEGEMSELLIDHPETKSVG